LNASNKTCFILGVDIFGNGAMQTTISRRDSFMDSVVLQENLMEGHEDGRFDCPRF